MAFCRARLADGSPPPSRAATISARESFEKRTPRFLSAAPFLCLIELHLLCPDMRLLFYQVEEPRVDAGVVGELGMERRDEHSPLARQHRMTVVLGEDRHVGTGVLDPRRADEDAAQRRVLALDVEVGLEAVNLPPPGVPRHLEVDEAKVVPVEDDHPRAGAENRTRKP